VKAWDSLQHACDDVPVTGCHVSTGWEDIAVFEVEFDPIEVDDLAGGCGALAGPSVRPWATARMASPSSSCRFRLPTGATGTTSLPLLAEPTARQRNCLLVYGRRVIDPPLLGKRRTGGIGGAGVPGQADGWGPSPCAAQYSRDRSGARRGAGPRNVSPTSTGGATVLKGATLQRLSSQNFRR